MDGRPGIAGADHALTGWSRRQSASPNVAAHHVAVPSNRPPGSRRLAVQPVGFPGSDLPFDCGFQAGLHAGGQEQRDRSLNSASLLTSTYVEIAARIESTVVVGTTAQHFILRRQWTVHGPLTRHPPARTAILWAPDDAVRDTSMAAGMALCTRSIPNGTSTYANLNAMIESPVVVSTTKPELIKPANFNRGMCDHFRGISRAWMFCGPRTPSERIRHFRLV